MNKRNHANLRRARDRVRGPAVEQQLSLASAHLRGTRASHLVIELNKECTCVQHPSADQQASGTAAGTPE